MRIVDLREWQWPQAVPSEDLMHSEPDSSLSANKQSLVVKKLRFLLVVERNPAHPKLNMLRS